MRAPVSLTAIVPATDSPATLQRCLAAIDAAAESPEQVVVVRRPAFTGPAAARNAGSEAATGDVLVFIDADVEVHPDAFSLIRQSFTDSPQLTALFGSYDDTPSEVGVVSGFRNLLHHHVHQSSGGRAGTFWAGLGAVRREAFTSAGGFSESYTRPSIEDIELGMRLSSAGAVIELDPRVQGKHLKAWTLWSMLRTDLLQRGVPWVSLLLRQRSSSATLNLGWRHRLSAVATVAAVIGGALQSVLFAGAAVLALLVLNGSFYGLLVRRRGVRQAAAGLVLHVLHLLVTVLALVLGVAVYAAQRQRRERAPEAPAGLLAPPA